MPINFPSNLVSTNGNFALILAQDTAIQGWTHVATTAERDALEEETMRCPGAVVVVGTIPYIYTSTDTTDSPWVNVNNWDRLDEVGGSDTIEGLTDVSVSNKQPNQVLLWDNSGNAWVNETLAYSDVAGTPVLGLAATTNLYSDLDSLPVLGLAATTNLYGDLEELPTFVGGDNTTIVETVNGAGGIEYTINATGGGGGGDATVAAGIAQFPDTDISIPLTGQVLVYDTNDGAWNNVSRSFANDITVNTLPASGDGSLTFDGTDRFFYSPTDTSSFLTSVSLGDLTDVDPTGATPGQILEYDGADWVAADAPADAVTSVNAATGTVILNLDDIEGVLVPTPGNGDVLQFNGVSWVNNALPGGGDAQTANGIDQFVDVGYAGAPTSGQTLEWVGSTWRNVASSKLDTLSVATDPASGGGSLSFDGADELTFTPADVPVDSVNGSTGVVVLDLDDLDNVPAFVPLQGDKILQSSTTGTLSWVDPPTGGGGDATVAGGLPQFDDTAITSPTNGQVLQYNNATSDWENINLPFNSIDITGSNITNLPGISAGIVSAGAFNSILVGSGTDYVPGYAADEHASMTFNGDPADGDYYMVLAMPCAAVIQSVTAKTVGSGAIINYQVMKGTLGTSETAVHAVTGATNTKANVASITSSSLAEGDELWVALDTAANLGQFTITVNYRPSPRFTA